MLMGFHRYNGGNVVDMQSLKRSEMEFFKPFEREIFFFVLTFHLSSLMHQTIHFFSFLFLFSKLKDIDQPKSTY